MRTVQIPVSFSEKLKATHLESQVIETISRCCNYYADPTRGLPFFPEYTDHGTKHIQRVLDAASWLITDEAEEILSPEDAAVITTATLLHDSAMHLTEDSFLSMITPGTGIVCANFDKEEWSAIWQSYFSEATHWDDRQLQRIIGDESERASDLAKWIRPIQDMGSPENWSTRYRKFIGEFIRRHHARLAHEFAIAGVPAPKGQPPLPLVKLNGELADLAGMVARSHNMSLRATFGYLSSRFYGRTICLGTHPVFLMVLLRIADFLQIDAERAPHTSLRVRSIRSPISRREWHSHLSIQEVRPDEHDSESIFVVARPPTAELFLKTRELLNGLQEELDTSWAVLGEIYSRQSVLNALQIRMRRVRSNLDDILRFREIAPYVPEHFAFDSAGPALLQKLVAPLYGQRVEVGIRELLQNAVDAVSELSSLDSGYRVAVSAPHVTVEVRKEDSGNWVIVEDFGIGMDEHILRSYFFKAGASFRQSDAWRRAFAPSGDIKVVRSGRFGVGVLAAFLLGDKIEVETRHHLAPPNGALRFAATVDSESIEVAKSVRLRTGTTVRVQVDEVVYKMLCASNGKEWDWFRWNWPVVERRINGTKIEEHLTRIPKPDDELPDEWHRLGAEGFDDVIWTFARAPALVCNGINIGSTASSSGARRQVEWEGAHAKRNDMTKTVSVPGVAVVDTHGTFPLNLQRFDLVSGAYPFADPLLEDVTKDFISFCLVFAPETDVTHQGFLHSKQFPRYPGFSDSLQLSFRLSIQWYFTNWGAGVLHWPSLRRSPVRFVNLVLLTDPGVPFPMFRLDDGVSLCLGRIDLRSFPDKMIPMALCHILGREISNIGPHLSFYTSNEDVSVFMSPQVAQALEGYWDPQVDISQVHRGRLEVVADHNKSVLMSVWKKLKPSHGEEFRIPGALVSLIGEGSCILAQIQNPSVEFQQDNAFVRTWEGLMPSQIIPYDLDERKRLFAETYEKLGEYIAKWERLRRLGPQEMMSRFRMVTSQGFHEKF